MSYVALFITLHDPKNTDKDQVLSIRPSEDAYTFDVSFKDTVRSINHIFTLDGEGDALYKYVGDFLRAVYYDDDRDGTRHVQIDMPGHPVVVIETHNLYKYISNVMDQLKTIYDAWPTMEKLKRTNDPSKDKFYEFD